MPFPDLKLVYGSGEIIRMLEDMLERAKAGRIDGLCVAFTDDTGHTFHGRAWKDDAQYVFARLVTVTDQLQTDLIENGL